MNHSPQHLNDFYPSLENERGVIAKIFAGVSVRANAVRPYRHLR